MQNVDARAGPLGEDRGAADRFDRDHRRARGDMRQRIVAAGAHQPLLAPFHDRVGLGVQRNALAGRRHDLEGFQHGAGRGRGDLAESVAHIELEADHAAGDQRRHVGDGVVAEQAVEAEIDAGFLRGDGVLGGKRRGVAGRRDGVRHVEHGGDAAERGGRGAARPVLLVRIAGIAEMDVNVDGAGQDMQPARVEGFRSRRHRGIGADRENAAVLDGDGWRRRRRRA